MSSRVDCFDLISGKFATTNKFPAAKIEKLFSKGVQMHSEDRKRHRSDDSDGDTDAASATSSTRSRRKKGGKVCEALAVLANMVDVVHRNGGMHIFLQGVQEVYNGLVSGSPEKLSGEDNDALIIEEMYEEIHQDDDVLLQQSPIDAMELGGNGQDSDPDELQGLFPQLVLPRLFRQDAIRGVAEYLNFSIPLADRCFVAHRRICQIAAPRSMDQYSNPPLHVTAVVGLTFPEVTAHSIMGVSLHQCIGPSMIKFISQRMIPRWTRPTKRQAWIMRRIYDGLDSIMSGSQRFLYCSTDKSYFHEANGRSSTEFNLCLTAIFLNDPYIFCRIKCFVRHTHQRAGQIPIGTECAVEFPKIMPSNSSVFPTPQANTQMFCAGALMKRLTSSDHTWQDCEDSSALQGGALASWRRRK